MSIDDSKRVDRAREDRMTDAAREPQKIRPKETDFDRVLEKSRLAAQLGPQTQQAKTSTQDAIREAVRREDRQRDGEKKDDGEGKEGRKDSDQKGTRSDGKIADQKVIAKGRLKQGGGGSSGQQGGQGSSSGRKELGKMLMRSGLKSVPVDLQGKFASRLTQAMNKSAPDQAVLTQQILNKLVQYVRVGINRRGEKEIQVDLSERIFRGLKLRVIARGGKVAVHFSSHEKRGKEALEKNREAIRDALKNKGIEVDEIVIN